MAKTDDPSANIFLLENFTSHTLEALIEWVTNHYLYFKDLEILERDNDQYEISTWDHNWIKRRETFLNVSCIELYNASEFFDIPKLIETVRFYIAFKYYDLDYLSIYDIFFNHHINITLVSSELIFYDIINYRSTLNHVLPHQKSLQINTNDMFNIKHYDVSTLFPKKRINKDVFYLLDSIEVFNAVNITKNEILTSKILNCYKHINFNFNINSIITIVSKFLEEEKNLNNFTIGGDFFLEFMEIYIEPLYFFNDLKTHFQNNILIQVYIGDEQSLKFNFYSKKFKDILKIELFDIIYTEFHQRNNSFKFKYQNFIFLFNFINKYNVNNMEGLSIFEFIFKHDINISKIFYSFSLSSVFVSSYMFNDFFNLKKIISEDLKIQDFSFLIEDIYTIKKILEIKKIRVLKLKKNCTDDEIKKRIATHDYRIINYLNEKYLPSLKYLLKGYFIIENFEKFEPALTFLFVIFREYLFFVISSTGDNLIQVDYSNGKRLSAKKSLLYLQCLYAYLCI